MPKSCLAHTTQDPVGKKTKKWANVELRYRFSERPFSLYIFAGDDEDFVLFSKS
jgi:hypothetical protein